MPTPPGARWLPSRWAGALARRQLGANSHVTSRQPPVHHSDHTCSARHAECVMPPSAAAAAALHAPCLPACLPACLPSPHRAVMPAGLCCQRQGQLHALHCRGLEECGDPWVQPCGSRLFEPGGGALWPIRGFSGKPEQMQRNPFPYRAGIKVSGATLLPGEGRPSDPAPA